MGSIQAVTARPPARDDRRADVSTQRLLLPLFLFLLCLCTTTGTGARFSANFHADRPPVSSTLDLWPWPWLFAHPEAFLQGIPFAVALLGILGAHELGHYAACRAHKIASTIPLFLPAPTLSGTAGAIIALRSRIPNRNALMDVGVIGPICGFLASILALGIGFSLSLAAPTGSPPALIRFGAEPLILRMVHSLVSYWDPTVPGFAQILPHPILVAGWIGLLITALNLVPAGQFDGGHLLYALSPRWHRAATMVLPILLMIGGMLYWMGWIFWGIFLLLPRMKHPRLLDEQSPLSPARRLLCLAGLLVLFLSLSPAPFLGSSLMAVLHLNP